MAPRRCRRAVALGGRAADAAAMARLAKRPTATWFADAAEIGTRVREASAKAAKAGRSALLVAYHVPGRDCGLLYRRAGSPQRLAPGCAGSRAGSARGAPP